MLIRYIELIFFLVFAVVWAVLSAVHFVRKEPTQMWLSIIIMILDIAEALFTIHILLGA